MKVFLFKDPNLSTSLPERTEKELQVIIQRLQDENDQLQAQLQSQLEKCERQFRDAKLKWHKEKCALEQELHELNLELKKHHEQLESKADSNAQSHQKQEVSLLVPYILVKTFFI